MKAILVALCMPSLASAGIIRCQAVELDTRMPAIVSVYSGDADKQLHSVLLEERVEGDHLPYLFAAYEGCENGCKMDLDGDIYTYTLTAANFVPDEEIVMVSESRDGRERYEFRYKILQCANAKLTSE